MVVLATDEPLPDLYAVLGVDATATQEDIRHAYRSAIQRQPQGSEKVAIKDAYEVLYDEMRRSRYDTRLFKESLPDRQGIFNVLTNIDLDEDNLQGTASQLKEALRKQYIRYIDLFHQMDANGSGRVSAEELTTALGELGLTTPLEAMHQIFGEFDVDGSGYICYEEFEKAIESGAQLTSVRELSDDERAALGLEPRRVVFEGEEEEVDDLGGAEEAPGRTPLKNLHFAGSIARGIGVGSTYPKPAMMHPLPFRQVVITSGPKKAVVPARSKKEEEADKYEDFMLTPTQLATKKEKKAKVAEMLRAKEAAAAAAALEPFVVWEFVNDLNSTQRASGQLAIVTHPLTCSPQNGTTPAACVARRPLHHLLVDAGYSVIAYSAHALSEDTEGETEAARLQAVLDYAGAHRTLRYCKIVVLSQGSGASAAFKALSANPEAFEYRVKALSACQPAGAPALREAVIKEYAPACKLPVLLSDRPPSATPVSRPSSKKSKKKTDRPTTPSITRVQRGLPPMTPSTLELVHNYPLYGKGRRFEGSRYFSDHPKQLLTFLHTHVAPPRQTPMHTAPGRDAKRLMPSASAPVIGSTLGSGSSLTTAVSAARLEV